MKALAKMLVCGRSILAALISLVCLHSHIAGATCTFFMITPDAVQSGPDSFTGTLPDGYLGTYYIQQIGATTGQANLYTFTVDTSGGSLPPGLTIDSNSGLLSGTPTSAGTFNFTIIVTFNNSPDGNCTEAVNYALTIAPVGPYSTAYVGNINLLDSGLAREDAVPSPGGLSLVIMGEYGSPDPSGSATPETTFPPWGGWITDVEFAGGDYEPNFTLYVLAPTGPGPNGEQQFKVVAASQNIDKGFVGFDTEVADQPLAPPVPTGPGDLLAFVGYGPNYNFPGQQNSVYTSPYGTPAEQGYFDATYRDAVQGGAVLVTPLSAGETITVGPMQDAGATYTYSAGPGHYALGVNVSATLTTSATAAPGQSAKVSGFEATATLQNSGSGAETLKEITYPANPNGTAAEFTGPGGYVDLSVAPQSTPGDGDTLTVTFYFLTPSPLATPPELYYFPSGSTTPELVLDQNGNPIIGTYAASVGGYPNGGYTFSVTLNDQSANPVYPNTPPATTPTISQLTGTLFAMGTLPALNLVAPPSAIAGQTVAFTVTTSDGSSPQNVIITGSDPKAGYPGYVRLAGGSATFNVIFNTPGPQTVTAKVGGYSPGTSSGVIVDCPAIAVVPSGNLTLSGTVGNPFYLNTALIGGAEPYTLAVTSGTLPAHLAPSTSGAGTYDEVLLSGTPTTPVTSSTFTVTATDADGCLASITYTMTINLPAVPPPTANSQTFATYDSPGAHVTLTGSDPNSLPLTYTVPVNTANGGQLREDDPGWSSSSVIDGVLSIQWSITNSASSVAPTLSYIPPDHPGADDFMFTVNNGTAYSPPATVSIAIIAAGQPLSTTLAPQAGLGGVTASLAGSASGHTVMAVAYATNPNGTAAAFTGPAGYVDLAVSPPTTLGDSDTLTATFFLPAAAQLATAPQLFYFPNGSTTPEPVLDQNGDPVTGDYSSAEGGYNFTVRFNDLTPAAPSGTGTTPTISQLTGTMFAEGRLATVTPPGTQLQVLVSPAEATAGTTPVAVTINAVNASGNPVNSADQVVINSSDPAADFQASSLAQATPLPQTVTLANGTATCLVTFQQTGQQVVTATDKNLAAPTASSPPVTVSCPAIAISPTTSALTDLVNVPFNLQVTATGSPFVYTYEIASGALPAGLALNPRTGLISGTPTVPGAYTFTASAIDGNGCTGSMTYTLTVTPPSLSQYIGNDLSAAYNGPDGDPPLVILGEYAPDSQGGPQASAAFTLVNGAITDVKFLTTKGDNYNFTLYVLHPGGSPGPSEQTFQIAGSSSVSGMAQTAGLQTVRLSPPLPASAGDLLAFLGVGPDYNSSDAVGSDATYEDADNANFSATSPGGNAFSVGEFGDANTRYDYVPDFFGNQGRTYAIGVDVSAPGVPTQLQVLLPGESPAPGTLTGKTGTPTPQAGAAPVQITVNAVDANFNPIATATPTVAINSTDPKAVYPRRVTLSGGTATFSATFYTTGPQTLTASDTATFNPLEAGSSSSVAIIAPALFLELVPPGVTIVPGSPAATGSPLAQTAGVPFPVTVYALDTSYNIVPSASPTVAINSSDVNAILPAGAALVNGVGTFNVTFKTAGNQELLATTTNSSLEGIDDGAIPVNPGPAEQLQVLLPGESPAPGSATGETGAAAPQITGTPVNVTVSAVDAYFNLVPTVTDTVAIGSSDPRATLPGNPALDNGTATFSVIFNSSGQQTVTATDANLADPNASSPAVTVACPEITLSPATAALSNVVNVPYSLPITATGSVLACTYQIASGALPAGLALNPVTGVISGTPSVPGASTFTVAGIDADGCSGAMTYTLTVSPGNSIQSQYVGNDLSAAYGGPDGDPPLVILGEYAPDSLGGPQAGSSFTMVNGTITDVKFLTTAGENYNFTLYVLRPGGPAGPGEQSFQIVGSSSVSGTALNGGLQTVTLTPPLQANAGDLLAFLGVGPDYNSTNAVGSDATYQDEGNNDYSATPPQGNTFSVGEEWDPDTRYDYLPFNPQGRTYAIGVDISFSSGPPTQLQVLLPGESPAPGTPTGKTGSPNPQITGEPVYITVNAVDANFYLVNTATPTVVIGSSDPSAILPGNQTLGNGSATFSVTFNTSGQQTVTASDTATSNPLGGGTSSSVTLTGPAVFLNIVVPGVTFVPGSPYESGFPQPQAAGVPFPVTVYALDSNFNIVGLASDTVAIAASDPNAILPPNAALGNGVGTFMVTLLTAGMQSIDAIDISGPLGENISGSIQVNPGPATQLQVLLPGESPAPGTASGETGTPTPQVAGTPVNVTVNAVDAYFNPIPTVTETVAVDSSDPRAILPGDETLGDGTTTFSVTFNTPGQQTVTANDTAASNPLASGVSPLVPVNILGSPAYNFLAINFSQPVITLEFTGIPGATYEILEASVITGPWTDISGNLTAAANGGLQYVDTISAGSTAKFYKVEYISGP